MAQLRSRPNTVCACVRPRRGVGGQAGLGEGACVPSGGRADGQTGRGDQGRGRQKEKHPRGMKQKKNTGETERENDRKGIRKGAIGSA